MRISVLKKCSVLALVAGLMFCVNAPAMAQYEIGSGNSKIGTVGDLAKILISPKIRELPGLQLGPVGLFPDSEVFPSFNPNNRPAPFVFALPNFGATMDFTGVTFDQYLQTVANSYEVGNVPRPADWSVEDMYLQLFTFQNEVSIANPGFVPSFSQVIQVHQQDFLAGGGYLPIPNDTRQAVDLPDEPVFEPFPNDGTIGSDGDPFEPLPVPTPESPFRDSASESTASAVSVVPEPATLGLLTIGAAWLIRRR